MLFDLTQVFSADGASSEVSTSLDMSATEVWGSHPFTSPVAVYAKAQNTAGMVSITITAEFDYDTHCDRCFDEIREHMKYTFTHKLIEALEEEYNDDYIETPDRTLQLDELVSSDILLELPSKFLCKRDCQGLCIKCGHNLNLGDCGCNRQNVDIRLEQLRQLLD